MKKLLLFSVTTFALLSVHAQVLYSTYEDWTNWNGGNDGATGITTFDYDGVTVNGIGNPTLAGDASVGGSLQLNPITPGSGAPYVSGSQNFTWGPGIPAAMMTAMDGPGFVAPGSSAGTLVAQSGTLLVDFAMPDHTDGGTTFQLGIWHNYNNSYGGWFATSQIDLGPVSTPNGTMEMYQAVIPYSFIGDTNSLTYYQFAIVENTDYTGVNPWFVDNISVVPLVTPPSPPPQTALFTTSNDFSGWSSENNDLVMATNDWSFANNTTNGLGNTNAPGATGTAGSLLLYWQATGETGFGTIANSEDEEFNTGFMQAIDPGCNTGSEISVPAYGNIYMNYSEPDSGGVSGAYFEVGAFLAYNANGYYQTLFPSATRDLGYQDDNGYEVYQATIPYTIKAGNYYGFTLGIAVNSNFNPTNGFHVDNITVSAAQAPAITSVKLNGTSLTIQGTNGLSSDVYTVLSSTNLALPLASWTAVASGTFYGPTWTNTITINPSKKVSFYAIQAP